MNMTLKSVALAAAFAVAAAIPMASPAGAGTPKNMLIMAKNIDDLITLDPAEVFEFTGGEIIANLYDRVMMFEAEDLSKLVGGVATCIEGELPVQLDVVKGLRERVEADAVADLLIVADPIRRRELRQVAFDDDLLEYLAGVFNLCYFIH